MFSRQTDRKIKKAILLSVLWLVLTGMAGYYSHKLYVSNIGYMPAQPVEFSHKVHAGDYGMKCLNCHHTAEHSEYSTVPATNDCMICHLALKNESEKMALVNFSFDEEIPIRWKKVYRLPDYASFNHSRHIRCGIDCSSCHGDVETMDTVYRVRKLSMQWCLDCHRDPGTYITPAREISGIFVNPDHKDVWFKYGIYNKTVEPSFGFYLNTGPEPFVPGIPMPKLPVPGPENCSACHY